MSPAAAISSPGALADRRETSHATAIAVVLAAMALVVLDASMISVALPTIAHAIEVAPDRALRIVSVYQTALVMALLPCAALGESFGCRRLFAFGVGLFVAASGAGALAPSLDWLLAARFLQGLGGAAIMALGVALLRQALPAHRIGAAIGWNALTVALCSAAGPALGAMVVSAMPWKWLFLVHLPLGLFALLGVQCLPALAGTGRAMDLASMVLSASAFACLLFGAGSVATSPGSAAMFLAASMLCFYALVRREMPKSSPLVPIDLLADRPFCLSVIASICCFTGQTAGLLALPFYLQHELGESALLTGLYMTPWPLAVAAAALIAGRLSDRLPSSRLCVAGGGLLAVGLGGIALLPHGASAVALVGFTIMCGLGFGLFQVPNNRTLFLSAPIERSAAAGGMQGTARLTGQTSGAILITSLFVLAPAAAAPRLGLAIGALCAIVAAIVSALPRRPAASSAAFGQPTPSKIPHRPHFVAHP